jgi:hypothetical protein
MLCQAVKFRDDGRSDEIMKQKIYSRSKRYKLYSISKSISISKLDLQSFNNYLPALAVPMKILQWDTFKVWYQYQTPVMPQGEQASLAFIWIT